MLSFLLFMLQGAVLKGSYIRLDLFVHFSFLFFSCLYYWWNKTN